MDTSTTLEIPERAEPNRRVRADLLGGLGVLTLVIGGHLLWFATDSGILAALG